MNAKKIIKLPEEPPYKCKLCGIHEILNWHEICEVCGWQDDVVQQKDPNYEGGANNLSFNQYKKIWETYKQKILDFKEDAEKSKSHLVEELYENKTGQKIKRYIPTMKELEEIMREDFEYQEPTQYEQQKIENKIKLVRNEFKCAGKYNLPIIRKQQIDLGQIDLISFTKTKSDDKENQNKTIHFFTYDWLFDVVYDSPEKAAERLKQYHAVLTPDFSMYTDMPLALQIHSTFKNRWCGAYWQSIGLRVIPTIEWGDERSFEFCFDGIEQGSVVAVSTYRREDYKDLFMAGYNKMLQVIKPVAIICFGIPFKEMQGNIKSINPYNS